MLSGGHWREVYLALEIDYLPYYSTIQLKFPFYNLAGESSSLNLDEPSSKHLQSVEGQRKSNQRIVIPNCRFLESLSSYKLLVGEYFVSLVWGNLFQNI